MSVYCCAHWPIKWLLLSRQPCEHPHWLSQMATIRESVDSLCREWHRCAIPKQKPNNSATNSLKAYLTAQPSSFRDSMISNTNILSQNPCGRQLNTKVCGSKKAIFLILSPTKISREWLSQVFTMVVARKWFIPQQQFSLIPSFSVTPIQVLTAVHSTVELLPIGWDAVFVCMRTCSLVPKPKTTVFGLGVRLIVSWPVQYTAGTALYKAAY